LTRENCAHGARLRAALRLGGFARALSGFIRDIVAIPATLTICVISGVLNAPPGWRRAACIAALVLALFMPWLATADAPMVRALCALFAALAVLRNLDLYRDSRRWSAARRAIHVVLPFDSRRVEAVARGVDVASWIRVAAFGVPTALAAWLLLRLGTPSSLAGYSMRWLCGALWAYTSFETLVAFARAGARLGGANIPTLHADPILSKTLGEFWSERWNLSVHRLLYDHGFMPLARRAGLFVAVVGTFAASAVLHFWFTLAAAGLAMGLSIASFFLIQGLLVLAERRAGVRRWQPLAQRAWTASCVLVPLPLLLEPVLRIVVV
jgi:hypothetical protein